MRRSRVLCGIMALLLPSALAGQPQPTGTLWRDGRDAVLSTPCPPGGDHDGNCRAIEVHSGGTVTKLGTGYARVRLLWARGSGAEAAGTGPDVLVLGDYGGSGGRADLFAVRLHPAVSVRTSGGERFDTVAVTPQPGPLRIDVPFDIEYFNGAPHAGAIVVPLPLRWNGTDFDLDPAALTHRTPSHGTIAADARAMRAELAEWARGHGATRRLYPPEAPGGTPITARTLVKMMLSGHADRAKALLDRTWPRDTVAGGVPLGGRDAFWNALCREMVRVPAWRRYRLARLPHADRIEKGAKQAG